MITQKKDIHTTFKLGIKEIMSAKPKHNQVYLNKIKLSKNKVFLLGCITNNQSRLVSDINVGQFYFKISININHKNA